jgi:hypothetical protein
MNKHYDYVNLQIMTAARLCCSNDAVWMCVDLELKCGPLVIVTCNAASTKKVVAAFFVQLVSLQCC